MNVPEVGDFVTLSNWRGEYHRVVHVNYQDRMVWLEYTNAAGMLDKMEYPLENDWIFQSRKVREMEDTREYLAALEKVYDRYFGL